jgi:Flp pilus assembly protein TadG
MRSPVARTERQRGAAAMEMAIMLPFLVILVMGVSDVGWLIWRRIELQEAVQEGTIYAAYNPDDPDETVARIVEGTNAPITEDQIRIRCLSGGSIVEVRVEQLREVFTTMIIPEGLVEFNIVIRGDVLSTDDCEEWP